MNRHFDVIIVGAGAAGLMCAMEAGKRGRRVLVVEKAGRAGNKIRISGGGKSNFTNLDVNPANYLSQNPHFCKSALARYTQWDFMALMSEHGLTWEEREHGQLFCEQGALAIVDMLLDECARSGVELCYDCEILALDGQAGFTLQTSRGDFSCDSLVIATGGPSIPRMGSTDFGVQVAKRFGLKSIPFRPALVPFTFPFGFLRDLAGISLEAEVSCNGAVFREQLLITHRGLSGPVILQVSSYWNKGDAISIDLLPGLDAADWLRAEQGARPNIRLKTLLSEKLPRRLAQALCEQLFDDGPLQQFQQGGEGIHGHVDAHPPAALAPELDALDLLQQVVQPEVEILVHAHAPGVCGREGTRTDTHLSGHSITGIGVLVFCFIGVHLCSSPPIHSAFTLRRVRRASRGTSLRSSRSVCSPRVWSVIRP